MGRKKRSDTSSEDEDFDSRWHIQRFTCTEPHTELCPFRTCRNADRYMPLETQRRKTTKDLRIADFSCSLRCEAPLADVLANKKAKKK